MRYPRAVYREVSGLAADPPITPVGLIVHVTASQAPSQFGWFNGPSGGIESHFHIPYDATVMNEQYRDTEREADANYHGNSWIQDGIRVGMLSCESQGLAPGAWTDHQCAEIIALGQWALAVHPSVAAHAFEATSYRSGGFGYHVQYPEWSNVRGKVCPGPVRIQQWKDLVLPAILGHITSPLPPVGPVVPNSPPPVVKPGVPAPAFPLPPGYFFGPKTGPKESVSGYFSYKGALIPWQQQMASRGWHIGTDGLYGPETESVALAFQREKHLQADGYIGPVTWAAAWTAPTT